MTILLLWRCDRCNREFRGYTEKTEWTINIPNGHISRTDCYETSLVHLCPDCLRAYNHWWMGEKTPANPEVPLNPAREFGS